MKPVIKEYISGLLIVLSIMTGWVIQGQKKVEKQTYIPIGLLVNQRNKHDSEISAHLAVKQINEAGGIKGVPLKLFIRSFEGNWGAGSREVVDLVFEEKVQAIIGSIDAENSHLAEQIIAKTQRLYLSTWASDPSLSNAYVPWFFSIVPTDEQQARVLLEEISFKPKLERVLIIYDATYDSAQALKSLQKMSVEFGGLGISSISKPFSNSDNLLKIIEDSKSDAVVLLGKNIPLPELIQSIEDSNMKVSLFTNLAATESLNSSRSPLKLVKKIQLTTPLEWLNFNLNNIDTANVGDSFLNTRPVAAYTYTGIMVMADAMRRADKDFGNLKESMSVSNFQGITGNVQFDRLGRLKNVSGQKRAEE